MSAKVSFQLTHSNKIRKVVNEVYLRKDIFCGADCCTQCYNASTFQLSLEDQHLFSRKLTASVMNKDGTYEKTEYLIVDTEVILHQMDLLQNQEMKNIILLQTVLSRIQCHDLQTFQVLRDLAADSSRHIYVFSNEFYEATHIEKMMDEKMDDFVQRSIRTATLWYMHHLSKYDHISVYLLTNDKLNAEKSKSEGILALTVHEYIKKKGNSQLLDTISTFEDFEFLDPICYPSSSILPIYQDHLSEQSILFALKSNSEQNNGKRSLYQGLIRQNRDNWFEANVIVNAPELNGEDILIPDRISMNRTIDGDVVLVQLLPENEWKSPSCYFVDADTPELELSLFENNEMSSNQDLINHKVVNPCPKKPTGKVVAIIKKNWRSYIGTIEKQSLNFLIPNQENPNQENPSNIQIKNQLSNPSNNSNLSDNDVELKGNRLIFVPLDRRIPKIKIQISRPDLVFDQRIVVSIDGWDHRSILPWGHYVRTLGPVGDKDIEAQALLLQHDIQITPFSSKILQEVAPNELEPVVIDSTRLDLRDALVFSIDPPGCTDIDDALHIRKLNNGHYQIGVHIADVTHYVKEGSFTDREARKRGNTIYLVNRRIDMLPTILGNDLCSLKSNVDRYAFSVLWEVKWNDSKNQDIDPKIDIDKGINTKKGINNSKKGIEAHDLMDALVDDEIEFINVSFQKTVIRSRASLTYAEAQARMNDNNVNDPITSSIKQLNGIAKLLRARRMEAGALTLSSAEVKFLTDETQDLVDIEMYQTKESNWLVEEFMLLANIVVAKQIYKFFPAFSLLRHHPPPTQSKFDSLHASLERYNIKFDATNSKNLAQSLDQNLDAICPNSIPSLSKHHDHDLVLNQTKHQYPEYISKSKKGQSKGVEKNGDPFLDQLLRIMVTRCMNQARYFSSGLLPPSQFYHYGLATPIYTHFTSPIRRYADIIVHRLLATSINVSGYSMKLNAREVQRTCDLVNYRHRLAEYASRDSIRYHTLQFFQNKVMSAQPAYILALAANGFDVIVPKYGIEGKVYLNSQGSKTTNTEEWIYYSTDQILKTTDSKFQFLVFQSVKVELFIDDQKSHATKLVFRCIDPPIHSSIETKNNEKAQGKGENDDQKFGEIGEIRGNDQKLKKKVAKRIQDSVVESCPPSKRMSPIQKTQTRPVIIKKRKNIVSNQSKENPKEKKRLNIG